MKEVFGHRGSQINVFPSLVGLLDLPTEYFSKILPGLINVLRLMRLRKNTPRSASFLPFLFIQLGCAEDAQFRAVVTVEHNGFRRSSPCRNEGRLADITRRGRHVGMGDARPVLFISIDSPKFTRGRLAPGTCHHCNGERRHDCQRYFDQWWERAEKPLDSLLTIPGPLPCFSLSCAW
jgi:hypothetical protein